MNASAPSKENTVIPALARQAVETFVLKGELFEAPAGDAEILSAKCACFVSLKTRAGDLRGCIGTIEPAKDNLASEIIMNAISAATRDPRFPPVQSDELPDLVYSVDILAAPEPACFEDLDPEIYGVIVEDEGGYARGLLLPAIAGVESASQQVEIAARKAGIPHAAKVKLWRFRVERFWEERNDPLTHTKSHES